MLTIVDAHHHLWDLEANPDYPWLQEPGDGGHMGPYEPICRSYRLDDYAGDMATVQVAKTVHIEAGRRKDQTLAETAWLQSLADEHGRPDAIVAYLDLLDPGFEAVLERHLDHPNLRGVRMRLTDGGKRLQDLRPGDTLMSDARWREAFGRLALYGVSFDLQAPQAVLTDAAELAGAFPDIPLVLTHAGFPLDRSPEGLAAWRDGLAKVAEQPNTSLKISGIPMTDHNWTEARLRDIVVQVVDSFGPSRCMFGTNFPVDTLYSTPERHLGAHIGALSRYSDEEREQVLSGVASRVYRL